MKGLEKLTKLKELFLQSNNLTDVKGLDNLTQLATLNLSANQLTNVKGLEKLTQLKVLNLNNNSDLTKTEIDELQKALPKCNIVHNTTK